MDNTSKKELSTLKVFLTGCFMGFADIIPGISGSTIAFILGVYEIFLRSLKSINHKTFLYFFTFRFQKIQDQVPIKFLGAIFGGIFLSLLLFSKLIHYLLSDPVYSVYLYSCFFGILLASIAKFRKQVVKWKPSLIGALILSAIVSFSLTYFRSPILANESPTHLAIFLAGFIATCAMLLPGISGSFVLVLLGMYAPMIHALSDLTSGFHHLKASFLFLLDMGMGIFFGFLLFSRFLLFFYQKKRYLVFSSLLGLMIGSMHAIWPFQKVSLENRQIVLSLCFMLFGYVFLRLLDQKKEKQKTVLPYRS